MAKIGYKFSASLTFLLTFAIFVISNRESFVREDLFEALWNTCLPLGTVFLILPMLVYSIFQIIRSLIQNFRKFRMVFYMELALICILSLFTTLTVSTIMKAPISYAKTRKVTDTALYLCDIGNGPLRNYITESFIPIITDPSNAEKLNNSYTFIKFDETESNHVQVILSCQALPKEALLFKRQNLVTNYKYRFYTQIDSITFEIYSNSLNRFIKPIKGKILTVNNKPDFQWVMPHRNYEVTFEFEGDSLLSYDVINNLKLIDPAP